MPMDKKRYPSDWKEIALSITMCPAERGEQMKPEEAIKIIRVAKAECEWNAPLEYQEAFDAAIDALEKQIPKPSAQPEPLTDKERRIFLAAMERERKVCKEVDREWRDCREPYEVSLVSVCNEIERKVKGALWMI